MTVGKLFKIDKDKTTIKKVFYLKKPVIMQLSKVQFSNSLDNSSNVKNISYAVSGYYVGQSNVISIGDIIEIHGRKYEIKLVNSTPNAMRRTLFNNYFEAV